MSRFWSREPCLHSKVGQRADDTHVNHRNNMAPLLRLDSTGEVTSDTKKSSVSGQGVRMCLGNDVGCHSTNKNSLSKFVKGLNMCSVIDTASGYLGSASSYLGGFCQYKSGKGLARSDSSDSKSATMMCQKYIQGFFESDTNMMGGTDKQLNIDHMPTHDNNCSANSKNPQINMNDVKKSNLPHGTCCTWSDSILGAIHSGLMNNKCPMKSESIKTPRPEPYRPPHMKSKSCRMQNVDPNLTPYNARLLQKSRRSHPNKDERANVNRRELFCQRKPIHNITIANEDIPEACSDNAKKIDAILDTVESKVSAPASMSQDTIQNEQREFDVPAKKSAIPDSSQHTKLQNDNCPDWFEYESDNQKTIPIYIEDKLSEVQPIDKQTDSQLNEIENQQHAQKMTDTCPALHSWLSMDSDVDVQKNAGNLKMQCHSSQNENENKSCDQLQGVEHFNVPTEVPAENEKIKESKDSGENSSSKKEGALQEKEHHFSVLYIRNCHVSKKGRPSSKKRRRQKAQQKEQMDDNCQRDETCSKEVNGQSGKGKRPNSSVSFILGIDSDTSKINGASHSFLMSCDIDSESDWTDSEGDSDSTLDDDNQFKDQLGGLGLFSPLMNFKVICSIQPTATTSSAIDAINLSWKVNFSVDSDASKKKATTKKVHFPSTDLATVHPMVTWSYAYQAARKGPWEEYARDRGRFQRRITDGESLLQSVLNSQHREKIYRERFSIPLK